MSASVAKDKIMSLLESRTEFKPFKYDWAYQAFQRQHAIHWIKDEVILHEDVKDWNNKLTPEEKNLLTQIFRFFTQGDVDVANGYINYFLPIFGNNPEVAMMLTSFAAMEGIHIDAYSNLIDTVGMEETEYQAFLEYEAMANKHEYLKDFKVTYYEPRAVAKALAVYSGFTEGLQLFSSFAMLLNFPRFGKMKGMGTIVEFSIRDESLHVEAMSQLFRTFIQENRSIWTDDFKREIYEIGRQMVTLEDKFIDLAFEQGGIEGLTADEVKRYVRFIANRRLNGLGLKDEYVLGKEHPLPWLAEILNSVEHTNFFENRVTSYSKGTLTGSWEEVWA